MKGLAVKPMYVYIMTNTTKTVLYTGVTNNLERRVFQHKAGEHAGFTRRYGCTMLVYCEMCSDARSAIAREKQIKGGSREYKEELINSMNTGWQDLAAEMELEN